MSEQLIIERLSSIEAKFDSHQENDNRIFGKLEEMHRLHFEEQKNSSILLTKAVADLTNIAENFRKYVIDSADRISLVDRKIESHIQRQQEFHRKVWWLFVASVITGVVSVGFKLIDNFYGK